MSEVTKDDILAGVQCELESMRTNYLMHANWCIEAVEQSVSAHHDRKQLLASLAKAAYHAGAARMLYLFSLKGSHTENVWLGKVHAYNRENLTTPAPAE